MIRLTIIVITLTILIACGDGGTSSMPTSPTPPVTTGRVQFRLDQNSCSFLGTTVLTFSFFVDGVQVGSAPLGLNQTSPPFTVSAASHVASANVTNTTIRWNSVNFNATAGQVFTVVLICT